MTIAIDEDISMFLTLNLAYVVYIIIVFDVAMKDVVQGHVERVAKMICGQSGTRKEHITYIRYVRKNNIAA